MILYKIITVLKIYNNNLKGLKTFSNGCLFSYSKFSGGDDMK